MKIITGTLMSKIIGYGLSPMKCAFNDIKCYCDGVVDSIKHLIYNNIFNKQYFL